MTIANIFDPEDLIIAKIEPLFSTDMVFSEADAAKLDNEFFTNIDHDDDRIACLVLNAGFRADPLNSTASSRQQKLKMLWQIVIVCPKSLRKTHGGLKFLEVVQLLKGWRVSPEIGVMQLVDDERGFNRPDYNNNMIYIPMMFTVETVI